MDLRSSSAGEFDSPVFEALSAELTDSSNSGYRNAPGYPGSLTNFTGSLQSGQTYRFMNFPGGLSIPESISDVTFYGCRFASNSLEDANVSVYGENITFDYSSFEPSAVSAPPVAYNRGYQYGIDKRRAGRMIVDHSDFWGWGNGIQFGSSSQAEPVIVRNSYFHHARQDGGIDHTDAILENYGGESYMVFDNNTIVSVGNTNGLALQGDNYHHVTITNNYFSGFGYTVNMCGRFSACSSIIFTDNTFGTDIEPDWGPLYGWSNSTNNLWRRNKWHVVPGSYYTNLADDGKFWWPDGSLRPTDYTGGTPPPTDTTAPTVALATP